MARRYVVQKIARTGTTIFKLEHHHFRTVGGVTATCLDEANNVKVWVLVCERLSEVHRDLLAGVGVVDIADDFSDKLEMLAGQCPLLCLGHLNNRHGSSRVKGFYRKD